MDRRNGSMKALRCLQLDLLCLLASLIEEYRPEERSWLSCLSPHYPQVSHRFLVMGLSGPLLIGKTLKILIELEPRKQISQMQVSLPFLCKEHLMRSPLQAMHVTTNVRTCLRLGFYSSQFIRCDAETCALLRPPPSCSLPPSRNLHPPETSTPPQPLPHIVLLCCALNYLTSTCFASCCLFRVLLQPWGWVEKSLSELLIPVLYLCLTSILLSSL